MGMGEGLWFIVGKPRRAAFALFVAGVLSACSQPVNSPYPTSDAGKSVLYSAFEERPKHLDPARSYSENEYVYLGNIYEPPLQYHYLKRPYQLEPQTAAAMPTVRYFDAAGRALPADAEAGRIAVSEYEIRLKPGTRYQPHPCFARNKEGKPRYVPIDPEELAGIDTFQDFTETGSRELTAEDYVYQIRRLAHPRVQSPILGLMADHIVGLKDLAKALGEAAREQPRDAYLDITKFDFKGAYAVDRHTYRVRIQGKYPQFVYWLAMPFFAPVPEEAERFYRQPGMAEKNFSLDWQPVGTGAYYLAENDPNRVMRSFERNPHYREDFYPAEGDPGDREAGLLADAGKRLPMVDTVIYSLEKEDVPYWNKFLQGYYDASGVSSDSFDQAIRMNADGEPDLTPDMRETGHPACHRRPAQPQLHGLQHAGPGGGWAVRAIAETAPGPVHRHRLRRVHLHLPQRPRPAGPGADPAGYLRASGGVGGDQSGGVSSGLRNDADLPTPPLPASGEGAVSSPACGGGWEGERSDF
jgi:oligopeptide transport system substrate-binding protein